MPFKPYLIGPMQEGWINRVEPFYLPEEAFAQLEDAYIWRGRVRKRFGYSMIGDTDLDSRLRIDIGTTDGNGDIDVQAPGSSFGIGQMFSVGTDRFSVNQAGTTASITNITQANPGEVTTSAAHGYSTNDVIYIDNVEGMTEVNQTFFTITVTAPTTFTIGVNTTGFGAYTMNGTTDKGVSVLSTGSGTGLYAANLGGLRLLGADATTSVYFYPNQPVMGLITLETSNINQEIVIAFDQQFSYKRSGGAWERITGEAVAGDSVWTGSDSNFFWGVNYRAANPYTNVLYVVNNNATTPDNIRYLNTGATTWTTLQPQLNSSGGARILETCRILVAFKDRLVAINTQETEMGSIQNFFNRARFSQNGSPLQADAWNDDVAGKGGYIDAPTEESAITAERLRDRLVVYFERSTWELVYTGNETAPFRWQQLNSELGCESTFSVIGFDKTAIGVGNVGVHECNGVNVYRIDEKIPNEVFKIHNGNNGPERVYGIRDYYNELVYWTFPDDTSDPTYPTRILVYNYENRTWSIFNDSFTCFGYFQTTTDLTWADLGQRYGTWAAWTTPWGSPLFQSAVPNIIAGNQQGWVFIIDNDRSDNAQSLYITDISVSSPTTTITSVNHNLSIGDYFLVEEALGITDLNGNIYQVETTPTANTFTFTAEPSGTYTGGGQIRRINNIYIQSKQFNPGTPLGKQFSFPYVDFLLNRTEDGQVSVDIFLDTSSNPINDSTTSGILLGTNTLFTKPEEDPGFQPNQSQIWHRFYTQVESSFLQFAIYMDDTQMRTPSIVQSDFELHAILLYAELKGRVIG